MCLMVAASWLGTPENSVGEWVAVSGTTAGISGMRSSAGKARASKVLFFAFCKYFMCRDMTTVGMLGAFG